MENKREVPGCRCDHVHDEIVAGIRRTMPRAEMLYDLADFFKMLGDSTRLNILFTLDRGPLCVCDIAATLGMTKSAVSHQLKSLRQASLVSYKKSGKNVFYELADDHVKSIIDIARVHLNHV